MIYDWRRNGRGDLWGGLNAAVVALPLAMAFGVESGLGAGAGLIGAFVLCSVAVLFGGTPLLISGPTAPMTVVSYIVIVNTLEAASTREEGLSTIFVIFLLSGLIQVLLGILKVGQYIRFAPYPLISGFLSGVGLLMVTLQIFPLIGVPAKMHMMDVLETIGPAFAALNWAAVGLGSLTILVIYLFPRITKKIPSTLVALVIVSMIAYVIPWRVPMIGDIPNEWLEWKWSHFQDFDHTLWKQVLVPSFTLALIGSVDTLLTSVVADMMSNSQHKSNRELIGQGVGNMVSALAGGLPGSGATVRTVLNIRSGARTRWSALIHSAFLLIALLEVSNVISFIPLPVLAGILITVGISIIDYKGLRDIRKISPSDAVVILAVLILTLFVGVLQAFAVGIVLASLFFVKKMADKNTTQTEPVMLIPENEDKLAGLHPAYLAHEVYIQEFQGPLFFGFSSYLRAAFRELPYMRAVIFRMDNVPFIDQSGMVALGEAMRHLQSKKIVILVAGLQDEPAEQLRKMNIIPHIVKEDRVFKSFATAADWLMRFLKENPSPRIKGRAARANLGLDELKHRMN